MPTQTEANDKARYLTPLVPFVLPDPRVVEGMATYAWWRAQDPTPIHLRIPEESDDW